MGEQDLAALLGACCRSAWASLDRLCGSIKNNGNFSGSSSSSSSSTSSSRSSSVSKNNNNSKNNGIVV